MAKAANSLLGLLRKGIESNVKGGGLLSLLITNAYMEHCVQLWAPQYKNKIDLLDSEDD